MAEEYYPFSSGAGADANEASWSRMAREWMPSGVLSSGYFALAAASLNVFADSTGMQVKIKPGFASVLGHYYASTAEITKTIAAANGSNPRIDRVVLRLDYSSDTITPVVITGTAAASPSAPAITQTEGTTWDVPLAQVLVSTGVSTIAADKITDERPVFPSADNAPRGRLASATMGSTTTNSGASAFDLVTTSVFVPDNRIIRITGVIRGFSGTADEQFAFRIDRNSTVIDGSEAVQVISPGSITQGGFTYMAEHYDTTAATYEYKLKCFRVSGSNNITVTKDGADGGAIIYVDDVGGTN